MLPNHCYFSCQYPWGDEDHPPHYHHNHHDPPNSAANDHLPVHIHAVPSVGELDGGVGLEHLAEQNALEDDPQVDAAQGRRDTVGGQLEAQRRLVAIGPAISPACYPLCFLCVFRCVDRHSR